MVGNSGDFGHVPTNWLCRRSGTAIVTTDGRGTQAGFRGNQRRPAIRWVAPNAVYDLGDWAFVSRWYSEYYENEMARFSGAPLLCCG